jgi:hypothetical protein
MAPSILSSAKEVIVAPVEEEMPQLRKSYDDADEEGLVHGACLLRVCVGRGLALAWTGIGGGWEALHWWCNGALAGPIDRSIFAD